jgi:hypothetical protein
VGPAPTVHDRPSPGAEAVSAIFQEDGAYARWRWWLDRFGAGEDHPMEGLVLLGEGAGLVTMQRLAEESVGAMNRRFGVWSRNLQRDMNAAAASGNRAYGHLQVVLVNCSSPRSGPPSARCSPPGSPTTSGTRRTGPAGRDAKANTSCASSASTR